LRRNPNNGGFDRTHRTVAMATKSPAPLPVSTGYWLFKSEPDVFSWDMQVSRGAKGEPWTGVRNYTARNNMRAMGFGDLGFFYHSNIGKEIVGIVRVIKTAYEEPSAPAGGWMCVDVEAVSALPRPVTLAQVKAAPALATMSLVTSMRLSVQLVTAAEWAEVCRMGGLDPVPRPGSSGTKRPRR
jgi:predicted RNA-binding protein with PUA-like domain